MHLSFRTAICALGCLFYSLLTAVPLLALDTASILLVNGKMISDIYADSIAVDSSGYPHILYSGDQTYYTFKDPNGWHSERLGTCPVFPAPGAHVQNRHAIHLDKMDTAHLLYLDGNRNLIYTRQPKGKGQEKGDTLAWSVSDFASALDNHGSLHIVFFADGGVRYATNQSGAFVTTTLSDCCSDRLILIPGTQIELPPSCDLLLSSGVPSLVPEVCPDTLTIPTTACADKIAFEDPSIAVDGNGNAHIAYICHPSGEIGNLQLHYASNNTGVWQTTTVDYFGDDGVQHPKIVLDQAGNPHITYIRTADTYLSGMCWGDCFFRDFLHTTNASGNWVTETVGTNNHRPPSGGQNTLPGGEPISLFPAFGPVGTIVYHYYYSSDQRLFHATIDNGTVASKMIDNDVFTYNGFGHKPLASAVGPDASLHVAYLDSTCKQLNYAILSGDAWQHEEADQSFYAGLALASAVDKKGGIHLAFTDNQSRHLQYGTNVSGQWRVEPVDDDSRVSSTSVAVDADGNVHITYFDEDAGIVRYARRSSNGWQLRALNQLRNPAPRTVVGQVAGTAFLLYLDQTTRQYVYSPVLPGTGQEFPVSAAIPPEYAGSFDMRIDSKGHFHLCYYDGQNLDYATDSRGTIETEVIDSIRRMEGITCNIDVDSKNLPHVVYLSSTSFQPDIVRYATRTDRQWHSETILDGYYTVGYASIAVDRFDHLHVSATAIGYLHYLTNHGSGWTEDSRSSGIPVPVAGNTSRPIMVLPDLNVYIPLITWTNDFSLLRIAPYRLVGDVDNSGTVDLADLILLFEYLTGKPIDITPSEDFHDINGNGHLDGSEGVWLLQTLSQLRQP